MWKTFKRVLMTPSWLTDDAVKLVSFDVFDTVIARRCGAPTNVFRMVGEKLAQGRHLTITPLSFQKLRVRAEQRAHRHKGNSEITLAEIYREMNSFWMLSQAVVDQMIQCEVETELENIFPIPAAPAMVQAVRKAGKRVAFTSDMYLPEAVLRLALTRHELIQEEDGLYVSSRWGVSKADGGLYRVLLEREKLLPSEVVHIGDSRAVDYRKARKLGIGAVHWDRGALNRYEARLAAAEEGYPDCVSRVAGISRMVRLEVDGSGEQQVAASLGASVAGPLLTAYAEWVLRTALSLGVRRLFFLARDGEALMRLCESLGSAVAANPIELRYLYGSRQVWYPAALLSLDEPAAEFFAFNVAFNSSSWQECVEHLGFSSTAFAGATVASHWTGWSGQAEDKQRLFLAIAADPSFGPQLRKWLAEKNAAAARYFREAGLIGTERCGLVDCGWSGTWTEVLSDMIDAQGGTRPEVYFLGRRKRKAPLRSHIRAFLYDQQSGLGLDQMPDFFHVPVEFFLTADHGRTVGFKEEAGKLIPVLAPANLQGFTCEQWRVFRQALIRFAESYAAHLKPEQTPADLRQTLVDAIALLWECPSRGEAVLLGAHTIALSPSKEGDCKLAGAYTVRDVFRLVFRFRLPGYPPHWWHQGSQVLSTPFKRILMGVIWQSFQFARALHDARRTGLDLRGFRRLCIASGRRLWWAVQVRNDSAFWRVGASPGETQQPPAPAGLAGSGAPPSPSTVCN
jgi:FMN phosphatase YigB (HAD superfamily)